MSQTASNNQSEIILPKPKFDSPTSIEKALLKRRSVRNYKDEPLTLGEISQLLWAAQGITHSSGLRTAPSAGALYPLEVYVVSGKGGDLDRGIYKYQPSGHKLLKIAEGDLRASLCQMAFGQPSIQKAAVVLVFSAVFERTTSKYGERGLRYVYLEAGHAAENVSLQAVSLNLGTLVIGAFYDQGVKKIIRMPPEEVPLYIMPMGK